MIVRYKNHIGLKGQISKFSWLKYEKILIFAFLEVNLFIYLFIYWSNGVDKQLRLKSL